MRSAIEVVYAQGERARRSKQGKFSVRTDNFFAIEYQFVGDKVYGRILRDIEESLILHVLIPIGETHVQRVGVNGDIHAALFGCNIQCDLAAGFIESSALGGVAQVVHFKYRPSVRRIDGIAVCCNNWNGKRGAAKNSNRFMAALLCCVYFLSSAVQNEVNVITSFCLGTAACAPKYHRVR